MSDAATAVRPPRVTRPQAAGAGSARTSYSRRRSGTAHPWHTTRHRSPGTRRCRRSLPPLPPVITAVRPVRSKGAYMVACPCVRSSPHRCARRTIQDVASVQPDREEQRKSPERRFRRVDVHASRTGRDRTRMRPVRAGLQASMGRGLLPAEGRGAREGRAGTQDRPEAAAVTRLTQTPAASRASAIFPTDARSLPSASGPRGACKCCQRRAAALEANQ